MRLREDPDRYNLAKFKILKSLANMGEANSIQLSKRTFKTIYETAMVLRRLVRQKHIKKIVQISDGCSFKYRLTKGGERYLLELQFRFLRGQSLNLYYPPCPAQLKPIDLQWKEQEYPTAQDAQQLKLDDLKRKLDEIKQRRAGLI
jgi:DNA-binding MarR family transcriptional regulator